MLFRKIVSVVIATAICASLCAISVSASGVPAANRTEGFVSDVKGATGNSPWARSHTKGDGEKVSIATMTVRDGQTASSGAQLILSYDTSNTGYGCKIVHSAFSFNSTASFQIRIRNGSSGNIQWMNFSSDGSTKANSSGTNKGATWTTGEDHRADIVADVTQGIGYLFIDGKLASFSTNLQKNGKWYGYLIYTSGTWNAGDSFTWKCGYSSATVNYVLYNDSEDYTVKIEDVLVDCGLSDAPTGDDSLFFESDEIRNYLVDAGYKPSEDSDYIYGDITYNGVDSATITGEYYNASDGMAQNFMRMLSGFYPEGGYHVSVGGSVLYISYTQVINSASRVEMRIRNNYTNKNSNRMTFVPTENGKMKVSSFSNTNRTLDKNWGDAVDVGIVVDLANHKAYSVIDGKLLGGAFDYFNEYNNFQDIRMYLDGTEENATSSVTISDWSMKLYDDTKDLNGLIAELTGMPVYFGEADNALEVDEDVFGMAVTAKGTLGAAAVDEGTKMYAAVYDEDKKLVGIDIWDYADGVTNDEVAFEYTGAEKTVKVFCLSPNLKAFAVAKVFEIPTEE